MYVGRILAVGRTSRPFVAYRVSSRSFPNRLARITGDGIAIQPLDPEDLKKNPYIAYNCIRVSSNGVVVSNGTHTDAIFDRLRNGAAPDEAIQQVLSEMGYEKDELNTPRIAGVVTDTVGFVGIVRPDATEVSIFDLEDNSCHFICTYELNRVESRGHPFIAQSAEQAARYIFDRGLFAEMELPVCSAAWMGELAVYNPHG